MAKRKASTGTAEEEINVGQLRAEFERAAADPATPAWVASLMRLMLVVVTTLLHRIGVLERQLFGRRSEKIPRPDREPSAPRKRASTQRRRIHTRQLPEIEELHLVTPEQKHCENCGGSCFDRIGFEESYVIEYIPGRLVRRKIRLEKCVCTSGCSIVQAPAVQRVGDSSGYGPALHAHVVVSRCLDTIPIHRQASQFKRLGCDIDPHVLNGLFHRAARELMPLHRRLKELLPLQGYINADETPQPVLAPNKTRRGFMWTFVASDFVVYEYSPSRSGETPTRLLGGSTGILQVDAYSGYNAVTQPELRNRAGCMAHVRRKIFDAQHDAPEAAGHALDLIHSLYLVEKKVKGSGITGSEEHRAVRQLESKPILDRFHAWLEEQKALLRPKSPLGEAVRYALNQWKAVTLYLDHPAVAIDNNIAELRLRVIALGRKTSLFVGSDEGGQNLAALMSLVTTAHIQGINPATYIADVLLKIQEPGVNIDELLPQNWKPAPQLVESG